jgi:hypothetical protein
MVKTAAITGRLTSLLVKEKKLEAQGDVDEHAQEGPDGRLRGLASEVFSNLGADSLFAQDSQRPEERFLLKTGNHRISQSCPFKDREAFDDPFLQSHGEDSVGQLVRCVWEGWLEEKSNVFLAGVVEVNLALAQGGRVLGALESFDDLVAHDLMGFELLFPNRQAGFFGLGGADDIFPFSLPDFLDDTRPQILLAQSPSDLTDIGRVLEPDSDERSPGKIDACLQTFAEGNINDPGHDDNSRQAEGDVFILHKIDVGLLENLQHLRYSSFLFSFSWRQSGQKSAAKRKRP